MFENDDYTTIIPFIDEKILIELDTIIENMSKKQLNKDEKMFYLYIEVGKLLHKDSDFFYYYLNLTSPSNEEKEIIHKKYNKLSSNAVVCKTAGLALLYAYKKSGLKCSIIPSQEHSTLGNEDIRHWFVSVEGEDKKNYYCNLVPDLMNIAFENMVEHFCDEMPVDSKHNFLMPGIDYYVMEKDYIKSLYKSVYDKIFLNNNYFNIISRKSAWREYIIESNPIYQELIKKYLEVFLSNPNNEELKNKLHKFKDFFDYLKDEILKRNNFIGTVEQINRYS